MSDVTIRRGKTPEEISKQFETYTREDGVVVRPSGSPFHDPEVISDTQLERELPSESEDEDEAGDL
jgi:hypothetical protein